MNHLSWCFGHSWTWPGRSLSFVRSRSNKKEVYCNPGFGTRGKHCCDNGVRIHSWPTVWICTIKHPSDIHACDCYHGVHDQIHHKYCQQSPATGELRYDQSESVLLHFQDRRLSSRQIAQTPRGWLEQSPRAATVDAMCLVIEIHQKAENYALVQNSTRISFLVRKVFLIPSFRCCSISVQKDLKS